MLTPHRPDTFTRTNPQGPWGICGEATVIESQGSQEEDSATVNDKQELFSLIPSTLSEIQTTLSPTRFSRYLTAAAGNAKKALSLYRWNAFLSHSLYWPSQTLEVAIRNSISKVLISRYGPAWHNSANFARQLSREDMAKLEATFERQRRERGARNLSVDIVVADLPFGFWTSMLSTRYDVPLIWRSNLRVAFPYFPPSLPLRSVHSPMERIRILRNRIAHHEPIFDRRLDFEHGEILKVIGWVCPATQWYVEQTTIFPETWIARPI
jgi:hypothetical protein